MNWQNIFDINNENQSAKITPTFLFTTIQPDCLNKIHLYKTFNDEFIFLRIKLQDRDANRIPQLVNEMLTSKGLTISKCKQSSIKSDCENVYVFDYFPDTQSTNVTQIAKQLNVYMKDNINVGDIIGNSGPITVGKGNKTKLEVSANDELAKKSYRWQKHDTIIMTIIGVVGLIIAYFSFG